MSISGEGYLDIQDNKFVKQLFEVVWKALGRFEPAHISVETIVHNPVDDYYGEEFEYEEFLQERTKQE